MKILTDLQREALLKVIAESPDDLLLQAANSVKQYRLSIQRDFEDIRGYVGMKATQIGQPISKASTMNPNDFVKPMAVPTLEEFKTAIEGTKDTTLTLPSIEPSKPNVEPSGEAAYKVGGETKMLILGYCSTPKTLDAINTHLKRGKGKLGETAALLKRLWNLTEILYDGEFYITKK
jgi:hypothetical protein